MKRIHSRFFHSRRGFSLIEIVLALGIISFALVGILGLFPVAVSAAANSQHETQAALIARSIFDQLQAKPDSPVRSVNIAETYDSQSPSPVTIDLSKSAPSTLIGYTVDGGPLASVSDPNSVFKIEIAVTPIVAAPLSPNTPAPPSNLSQVVVTVNWKNTKYPFSSLLRQQ